jgi:lysyl-tRNA synthetase class 2
MMQTREILRTRQDVRQALREIFNTRGFLEVDTPVLSREVLPEAQIDPLRLRPIDGQERFLQASPEAHMKRLLASGSGAIYQLAHAFRDGERGPRHDIEFLLLEWYAPGTTLDDAAQLLEAITTAVLGTLGLKRQTCQAAFAEFAQVDLATASASELQAAAVKAEVAFPESWVQEPSDARFDRFFELLLSEVVSPQLGHTTPVMLEAWPRSQSAFARIDPDNAAVARRFELFYRGIELANGWEEETSATELLTRLEHANSVRAADGRAALPIPQHVIAAHQAAMPEGVGAALGFDRLVMLAANENSIDAVRCFSSDSA